MKKKYIFLLPLLVAPFLMGCNQIQYYSITFDAGDGCFDYNGNKHQTEIIKVAKGQTPKFNKIPQKIDEPFTNKTRNYPFTEWSPKLAPATSDATYVAHYSSEGEYYCTVTMYTFDNDKTIVQEIKEGEKVNKPSDPTVSGGEFQYWTADDPVTTSEPTEFDFDAKTVNDDLNLYAYYTGVDYNSVTFDAGEGNFGSATKKSKRVIYLNERKFKDFNAPSPLLRNYSFNGYSVSDSGVGPIIDPEATFSSDEATIYASYSFNLEGDITLVEGTTLQLQYSEPRPSEENFRIRLAVKPQYVEHYAVPTEEVAREGRVKITNKVTKDPITDYEYECNADQTYAWIYIPKAEVVGGLNVTVGDYSPTYASQYFGEHISFVEVKKPKRGDDYSFVMEIPSNAVDRYRVPEELSIYVTSRPETKLPSDCYQIVPDKYSNYTKATVTISGKYVKGDLVIIGSGVLTENSCGLVLDTYGLLASPNDFLIKEEGKFQITFEPEYSSLTNEDSEVFPNSEDIYFRIDGEDTWHNATESEYVTYNISGAKATLKFNLDTLTGADSIHIITRAKTFPLLDVLSWDMIEQISDDGLAPYFFFLGEEKQVEVKLADYPVTHTIRIIDFNHDQIAGEETGTTAGITFEFKQVLTDSVIEGKLSSYYKAWSYGGLEDGDSSDFVNKSQINDVLHEPDPTKPVGYGEVYKAMPSDLLKVAKVVKKDTRVYDYESQEEFPDDRWIETTYDTTFFPLSAIEIDKDAPVTPHTERGDIQFAVEGTTYAYFDVDASLANERRAKTDVLGEKEGYWLRSPIVNQISGGRPREAGEIFWSGKISPTETPGKDSIAPAFCV